MEVSITQIIHRDKVLPGLCRCLLQLRRAIWRGLLSILLLIAVAPAWAQPDLVVQKGFLVDPDGTLSISEVQGKPFKTITGPLARGYTASITWMRVVVAPSDLPALTLTVQPTFLDNVRLYSPTRSGNDWAVQQSGDWFPYAERSLKEVIFSFAIVPDRVHETVHYLRVGTTGSTLLHVKVMQPDASLLQDNLIHVMLGLYEGFIFVLLSLSLTFWYVTRDRLWAFDALFQCCSILYTFTSLGFTAKYFFPNDPMAADLAMNVLVHVSLLTASLFFWNFYKAYSAPGWMTWMYQLAVASFPVMIYLVLTGKVQIANSINANLILVETIGGVIVVWFAKIEDRFTRLLVRSMFMLLILYMVLFILPLLGLMPMSELNLYPTLFSNLLIGVMLQLILGRRTQLQIRERWQLQAAMQEVNEKLKWEMTRRAEATSFMGMLMHELKNPLAAIRIATQSLVSGRVIESTDQVKRLKNIQKSVEGIDAVLERCIEADRLEQGAISINKTPQNVAFLLADWCSGEVYGKRVVATLPAHCEASIDAPLLYMMVRNLLSNALTYSPDQSPVYLTLSKQTVNASAASDYFDGFMITVRNQVGRAGVPDPARVFEKYYRAPTAHHFTGTGLGLYWVRNVAKLLGGGVHYRAEHQDVIFELWLPR